MQIKRSTSRWHRRVLTSVLLSTALLGTALLGAGTTATAAPRTSQGVTAAQAAAPAIAAAGCGFHTVRISSIEISARYWNCDLYTVLINIDKWIWPDSTMCVRAGTTVRLGAQIVPRLPGDVVGASVIGHC